MSKQEPITVNAGMYSSHTKIHPREIKGPFQTARNLAVILLLGIFYGLPWINWDGRQAVLFDLPVRQFHIFGLTFWPQDFLYLALLLIIAALSLFFFTALAGRLWCGYACPQTVWTEAFIWMERWTEGNRQQQMKLDKLPWSDRRKLLRRGSKHVVWIVFALFTGFTFVGYFTPITELAAKVSQFDLGGWEAFWLFFYGFATWGNAGFMREQVCIYMCPYARFQSAMFDRNTLVISYDEQRGEPRGKRPRGVDHKAQGLGDCIGCQLCVQVCPTGIDIRDGLQYECIACAACVDACDSVMDKVGYPRGLVRYTTENALMGLPSRVLRPRVLIYGLLLLVISGSVLYSLTQRVPLRMEVLADRNVVYREVDWQTIENVYTVRILNKDDSPHAYTLRAEGIDGMRLVHQPETLLIGPGDTDTVVARVQVQRGTVEGAGNAFEFVLESNEDPTIRQTNTSRFVAPEGDEVTW